MHRDYEQIAELIRDGLSDTAIVRKLAVHRRTVARIRLDIGVAPLTNATTVEEKLIRHSVDLGNGHTGWTGRTSANGGPLIRHRGSELSASAVVFARYNERPPIGMVKADCDVRHCLTARHLLDDPGRRAIRLQLRALNGWKPPWNVCRAGHDWDTYGRVEPDLALYCAACGNERKRLSNCRKGRES